MATKTSTYHGATPIAALAGAQHVHSIFPSQMGFQMQPASHSLLALNETCPEDDDDEFLDDDHDNSDEGIIAGRKRLREDEAPVGQSVLRWGFRPVPCEALFMKAKEELEDIIEETAPASTLVIRPHVTSSSSTSSPSDPSLPKVRADTTPNPKDQAVSKYWKLLIERFGGEQADGEEVEYLLEIMEIISLYANSDITIQTAFSKLDQVFRSSCSHDLYEGLVRLLLQLDVRKDFLKSKGVDIAFLSSKGTASDGDDYRQEHSDSDQSDSGEGSDVSLSPPTKKKRKKSNAKRATRRVSKRKVEVEEAIKSDSGRQRSSPDKWTPEEDEKLIALVEKYGVDTKKWRQIAEELGTTKNSAKCAQHWRRVLAPNIHKGSWTAEEEEKLLAGVKEYGLTQWTLVAKDIPGRTDIQCRYHYMRQLNSRKISWTIEEENMLAELVAKYGEDGSWVKVSDMLAENKVRRTPRTALECQEHWQVMQERDKEVKETATSAKDAAQKKKRKK